VGPRWGPLIINGAYLLICATNRDNIHGACRICATDKTWYFVDNPSSGSHMVIRGAFCPTCAISSGVFWKMCSTDKTSIYKPFPTSVWWWRWQAVKGRRRMHPPMLCGMFFCISSRWEGNGDAIPSPSCKHWCYAGTEGLGHNTAAF
jgi:hypothetical protein